MSGATRREAIGAAIGAAAACVGGSARAIGPIERVGGSRLKLSCCAYSYRDNLQGKAEPRMTLFDFLETAARMPLDGVELTEYYFPKPLPPGFAAQVKRRCFLLGLDVSGSAMGSVLTHPAGANRERQIAAIRDWLQVCEELGAPCLRLFAGGAQKGQSEDEARACVVETIEALHDDAARHGVVLALENHGGVVAEPEGVLAIVQAVKSDWFGVNLDTGNFHGDDPYADLARVAPYAVTSHVKIAVTPRGKKAEPMDYARLVKLFRNAGYRGYLALEYEGAAPAASAVPPIIARLRSLI
jgi:sugar phosphate isomerase/epimerase